MLLANNSVVANEFKIYGVVTYVPEEGTDDADNLILKGNYKVKQLKISLAYASIG